MQIQIQQLAMSFQDAGREIKIFEGLNLDLQSGSSLAIVGASGVGKSTFLYLLGALEKPTSGNIILGDKCITDASMSDSERAAFRGKHLGFVFQFHHLLPEFDALENVAMPLRLSGEPLDEAQDKARELLKRVGLEHRLTHRPGMLSGGEQQRVAIARALVGAPGIILADEPTGNLDGQTGALVSELLLELQKEYRATMVVVTHSPEVARKMDYTLELVADGLVRR